MGYQFASPPPVGLPFQINLAEAIPAIRKAFEEGRLQKQVNYKATPAYGGDDGPCAVGVCIPKELGEWIDAGNVTVGGINSYTIYGASSMAAAGVFASDNISVLGEIQALHDAGDWPNLDKLLSKWERPFRL